MADFDEGEDGPTPEQAKEMNAMHEAMRDCKVNAKGTAPDVFVLMERSTGAVFVVRMRSGAKAITAGAILKSFCKQHVKRCPDDAWWANAKDCALWHADDMHGDDDWELAPTARLDHGRTRPGPYVVRRTGQTKSFRALRAAMEAARDREDGRTDAERVAATVAHFDKDAQKYMELRRNVLTMAEAGNAYGTRCAHFLARPRSLLFENCHAASKTYQKAASFFFKRGRDLPRIGCGSSTRGAATAATRPNSRAAASSCAPRAAASPSSASTRRRPTSSSRGRTRASSASPTVVPAPAFFFFPSPSDVETGRAGTFARLEVAAGDWDAHRVDGAPFDAVLLSSVARYVPWAMHAALWRKARNALAPTSGCLVVGEVAFDEARAPLFANGAHHEVRTWLDYKMALEKAGFVLEHKEDYDVDKTSYWAAVWRRKPERKRVAAAPEAAPVCGLP